MSTKVTHTMTVTETTSTMPPQLAFNIQTFKTKDGLLKFFEMLLGIICVVLYVKHLTHDFPPEAIFPTAAFLLCTVSCFLPTFLLLISYLMSPMAANTLPKIIFDLLQNVVSSLFYVTISMSLLAIFAEEHQEYPHHEWKIFTSVLGVVNGLLYGISAYFAFKAFRSP